nr:polymorphic toxin type 35 domain-containing protein [Thermoanaerobacterium thermosaccharolyticum]
MTLKFFWIPFTFPFQFRQPPINFYFTKLVCDCPNWLGGLIEHDWDKIIKGTITWEKVRDIIEKVMKKGTESRYGSAYKRVLKVGKETVTVTFQKINDSIWKISDAWVNKK